MRVPVATMIVLSIAMVMILVIVCNDLLPGGIVDPFYLAVMNPEMSCAICLLKNCYKATCDKLFLIVLRYRLQFEVI